MILVKVLNIVTGIRIVGSKIFPLVLAVTTSNSVFFRQHWNFYLYTILEYRVKLTKLNHHSILVKVPLEARITISADYKFGTIAGM